MRLCQISSLSPPEMILVDDLVDDSRPIVLIANITSHHTSEFAEATFNTIP